MEMFKPLTSKLEIPRFIQTQLGTLASLEKASTLPWLIQESTMNIRVWLANLSQDMTQYVIYTQTQLASQQVLERERLTVHMTLMTEISTELPVLACLRQLVLMQMVVKVNFTARHLSLLLWMLESVQTLEQVHLKITF